MGAVVDGARRALADTDNLAYLALLALARSTPPATASSRRCCPPIATSPAGPR